MRFPLAPMTAAWTTRVAIKYNSKSNGLFCLQLCNGIQNRSHWRKSSNFETVTATRNFSGKWKRGRVKVYYLQLRMLCNFTTTHSLPTIHTKTCTWWLKRNFSFQWSIIFPQKSLSPFPSSVGPYVLLLLLSTFVYVNEVGKALAWDYLSSPPNL